MVNLKNGVTSFRSRLFASLNIINLPLVWLSVLLIIGISGGTIEQQRDLILNLKASPFFYNKLCYFSPELMHVK